MACKDFFSSEKYTNYDNDNMECPTKLTLFLDLLVEVANVDSMVGLNIGSHLETFRET